MKISLFLLLVISFSSVFGNNYPCVDINFTPYSGAENILFVQNGFVKIDNFIFPTQMMTDEDLKNPDLRSSFADKDRWIQIFKSLLFWVPFNASCTVTQHEVFGHGYRIRDLGSEYVKVTGYGMYVIGGSTSFDITNKLTISQLLAINVAGLEANAIMTNKIRLEWLNNGYIDPRQYALYFISSTTLPGYALTVKENPKVIEHTGNDISDFLVDLNCTYRDSYLTYTKLRNLSLINCCDPFLIGAIIAHYYYANYNKIIKFPMFQMGPVRYLPVPRIALTPFGLQGYLENYFVVNSVPIYFYLKWGKNGPNSYYGTGVENRQLYSWQMFSLGFRADWWFQPHVLFEQGALSAEEISELPESTPLSDIPPIYPSSVLNHRSFGGAFSLIGSYSWSKWPVRMFAELGYKSEGYLPGEALRESPIVRGGLSGQF